MYPGSVERSAGGFEACCLHYGSRYLSVRGAQYLPQGEINVPSGVSGEFFFGEIMDFRRPQGGNLRPLSEHFLHHRVPVRIVNDVVVCRMGVLGQVVQVFVLDNRKECRIRRCHCHRQVEAAIIIDQAGVRRVGAQKGGRPRLPAGRLDAGQGFNAADPRAALPDVARQKFSVRIPEAGNTPDDPVYRRRFVHRPGGVLKRIGIVSVFADERQLSCLAVPAACKGNLAVVTVNGTAAARSLCRGLQR